MTLKARQRNAVITSVGLAVFFLVLSIWTMGLSQQDDSWYLSDGVTMELRHFFYLHYWSPLYILWLRVLSWIWHDPVWRYFASWALLTMLMSVIPVLFKLRYAWLYTVLMLVVGAPTLSPYIGMFAGVVALLALCFVIRARLELVETLTAACATCVVLGYCRPEFDYGVFLAAMATLVVAGWERRKGQVSRRMMQCAAAVLVLAVGTALVMHHAVGQRSGLAFAQHYNRRAQARRIISWSTPSWQADYAERVFGVDLGHNASNGTATLGEFFRAKPGLFLHHVFDNLLDPMTLAILLLVAGAVAWPWLRADGRAYRTASVFLAVMVTPVLMDMLIIFPRDHYIMILLPSVTIFALQAIRSDRWLLPSMPWVLAGAMALMFYLKIEIPRQRWDPPTADRVMLSQVNCMREIDRSVPASSTVVFDSVGIRDVYLTTQRAQKDPWALAQWADFKRWVLANHPGWVTVDVGLAVHYGVTPEQLQGFLSDELGYVAHACPVTAGMTMYTAK